MSLIESVSDPIVSTHEIERYGGCVVVSLDNIRNRECNPCEDVARSVGPNRLLTNYRAFENEFACGDHFLESDLHHRGGPQPTRENDCRGQCGKLFSES